MFSEIGILIVIISGIIKVKIKDNKVKSEIERIS